MARILTIDDSPLARSVVRIVLERDGHTLIEARDGIEGLDIAISPRPAVILCGVSLPVTGPHDVAPCPRGAGITAPIVALTAHDDPETVSALTDQIGFDAVISKGDAIGGLVAYWESNGSGRVGAAA